MYSLSLQQLGQYISRTASNVVWSHRSIPTYSPMRRARGSYSSAVQVRLSGKMTRRRGAAGICFRVEYTQ